MRKSCVTIILCVVFAFFAQAVFSAKKPYQFLQYKIQGITDKPILKNVDDSLLNLRSELQTPITTPEVQQFIQKAPTVIQNAIKPYGYFHGKIHAQLQKKSQGWLTQFTIALGDPVIVQAVHIRIEGEGKNDAAFQQWLAKIPVKKGEILNTVLYDTLKTDLYNVATERGYFDAILKKSQITLNLQTKRAVIDIVFDTKKRYQFGQTVFSHSPFSQAFLRRFLRYKPGQDFDAKKLEKTQEGLVNSNYFNQALINPLPKKAVHYAVPIRIALIPRKAKEYTVGAGYGTDTGVRGTLGMTLRQIGTEGHRFHALLRASQKNSSVTTKYLIPGPDPARDLFSIGAGASNITQPTGSAKNARFGFGYTLSYDHWKNTITLVYLNERYNIQQLPTTSTALVYPTLGFKYLSTSNSLKPPPHGMSFDVQLAGATKKILSQSDFFQIVIHWRTLFTLKETKTRFIFRTDLGHTNITNLVRLPLSLQLLAGGARSVRGYGFNSIGPGRNLIVASQEIQQHIFGNFYLAGFVDAGVVGNKDVFRHINVGVGPGIAWLTPIGTIELTEAQAITQPTRPWTIQFTMGTEL